MKESFVEFDGVKGEILSEGETRVREVYLVFSIIQSFPF